MPPVKSLARPGWQRAAFTLQVCEEPDVLGGGGGEFWAIFRSKEPSVRFHVKRVGGYPPSGEPSSGNWERCHPLPPPPSARPKPVPKAGIRLSGRSEVCRRAGKIEKFRGQ